MSSELSHRPRTIDGPALEVPPSPPSTIHPRTRPTRSRTALDWIRSLGSGVVSDIRSRAPFYLSDWSDAWNYRVVPATALIFFAKWVFKTKYWNVLLTDDSVLPGIAFSLDLIETTNQYGVSEVLISSFMAAFIFSCFGAQPLTIAGVTGPYIFHLCCPPRSDERGRPYYGL